MANGESALGFFPKHVGFLFIYHATDSLPPSVNVKMLSSLLDQRRSIRSLANTEIPIEEGGHIVVTWVDALIAALSHSISTLLEEFDSMFSQDSIRPLRDDDQIRAVCLLPSKISLSASEYSLPRLC